jgi:hypothetical protein
VIATRAGEESADVAISRLARWSTRAEVYTEGRSVQVVNGVLVDRFERWAVHVYRLRRPG